MMGGWWNARQGPISTALIHRHGHRTSEPGNLAFADILKHWQRQWGEGNYSGPARVPGSAGTGKTIVALHRAVFLARTHPDARVLLCTFSDTLANALRTRLIRLISHEPRLGKRLEVHAMNAIGRRLYELHFGRTHIAFHEVIQPILAEAAREVDAQRFSRHFSLTEWEEVVDAWQLDTWEAYRDVRRLGRKTRLPELQRAALLSMFDRVRSPLQSRGCVIYAGMFSRLAAQLAARRHLPFDFAVVDEAADIRGRHAISAIIACIRPDA